MKNHKKADIFSNSANFAQNALYRFTDVLNLRLLSSWPLCIMALRVVNFSGGGYKIRNRKQHTQSKLLNFENWVNGEVSNSAKI